MAVLTQPLYPSLLPSLSPPARREALRLVGGYLRRVPRVGTPRGRAAMVMGVALKLIILKLLLRLRRKMI